MKLQVTPGAGRLTLFTVSVDTETLTLVSDPAHDHRPAVPLREWVGDTGGARPLPGAAEGSDDGGVRVRRDRPGPA